MVEESREKPDTAVLARMIGGVVPKAPRGGAPPAPPLPIGVLPEALPPTLTEVRSLPPSGGTVTGQALPETGNNGSATLITLAATTLAAGLIVVFITRRRRPST